MQVLHTHWLMPRSPSVEGGLFVWAETSARPQPKRDRRKKATQLHSFALDYNGLVDLIRSIIPWHKRQFSQHAITLWLPTNKFSPTPAPELLHDWERDDTPPELRSWRVQGIWLSAGDGFRFLVALNDIDLMGTKVGGDGRFLQHAINFVLEILAQQKLRPTLVAMQSKYEARWQPILDNEQDARRLAQFAAAMPASAQPTIGSS